MTVSKTALSVTTLAFVGLFGGGIFLFTQAGSIVKGFLETTASQTLGVPVTIDNVVVNLKDKQAALQGLTIGNAPGFDKPHSIHVAQISAKLGALSKALVVIEAIEVSGTDVNLELTKDGSNLVALKNGIKVKPAAKAAPANDAAAEGDAAPTEPMKVIIDRLTIGEIAMHPSVNIAKGLEIEKDVTVPQIVMRDIGRKDNGVVAQEAIAQVLKAVMTQLNSAASSAGLSPEALLKDAAQGKIDEVKDKLKDKLNGFF